MLANITETDRGAVLNIEGIHALLPSDAAYAPLASPARELVDTVGILSKTLKEEALPSALLNSTAGRNAIAAARVTYGALVQRKRDAESADRKALERSPSIADDKLDPEYFRLYRTLGPADQTQRALQADLGELAAIALNPALAGLSDDVRNIALERYVALNWADKVGLAGSYPAKPSLDGEILATGVNHAAVEQSSRAALEQHKQRMQQSKADEAAMRNLIAVLSAAFGIPANNVLELILP